MSNTLKSLNNFNLSEYTGLNSKEITERIKNKQTNKYTINSGRSYWQILKENVFTLINLVLALIAGLLAYFGSRSDALIYFSIALLNIVVGLVQEVNAKMKLDSISSLISPTVQVLRNGIIAEIKSVEIVIDDLIILESGSIVPADGEVVNGVIECDESLLTGESELIQKSSNDQIYSGSTIVTGKALCLITKVANNTIASQIAQKARAYTNFQTPLQREMNLVVRVLFLIAIILGIMTAIASFLSQVPISDSIRTTAVILGIVPNSLFAMINLSYALGGVKILQSGALIQKLNAVESLSNVDILCIDKTGTLTTKNLILEEIYSNNKDDLNQFTQTKDLDPSLLEYTNLLSNHNATSESILKYITNLQNNLQNANQKNLQVLSEIPFNSSYKWSLVQTETKNLILGAPEVLIPNLINFNSKTKEILTIAQSKGLRVLFFGITKSETIKFSESSDTNQKLPILPSKIELVNILVFSDQIRPHAKETLAKFQQAGVRIKIISGDNVETVKALAKQVNLSDKYLSLSGLEIDKLSDQELAKQVEEVDIFGRITPEQKERIIKLIALNGHYTAMIGDGVNDVMSLKQANLGIAMESGSEATRAVADILLLKDSFESLPKGLIEGQKIRNGLTEVFKIYLTRITYLTLVIIAIRIAGLPFPFTVKQSSLLALFTTALPAIGLTVWSHAGVNQTKSLFQSVLRFVFPAAIITSLIAVLLLIALTLNQYFIFQESVDLLKPINLIDLQNAIQASSSYFQTILVLFLVYSGLSLVILASPPSTHIAFGASSRRDWRPTILILCLVIIFQILYFIPSIREFWELQKIGLTELLILGITYFVWLGLLILTWKYKLINKLLGL